MSIRIEEAVTHWRSLPMRQWPAEAFDELGLRNPYAPGNMTIRHEAMLATQHVQGAVVECGVYQGQGLATLLWLMREARDRRAVFGFDSFHGFPPESVHELGAQAGAFTQTTEEQVRQFLNTLGLSDAVTIIPGYFSETLASAPIEAVSLLILDCDLSASYHVSLEVFYPKLQPGGWIVLDEYASPKYSGARRVVDQFFADKPETPQRADHLLATDPYERWYVVKASTTQQQEE